VKIAISGTHGCGKSTLIEEFLRSHPSFAHEPEPYTVLEEDYGEVFAAEPSLDDFYRQLEFNAGRLRSYTSGQQVIYERCPADFLSYMVALDDLRRERQASRVIESALEISREVIQLLDLIVFLPLEDYAGIITTHSEDPELREAVDFRLAGILSNDDLQLFGSPRPEVVEARGSTAQRLQTLEHFLDKQQVEKEAV
jgi:AAA domain-containing protein